MERRQLPERERIDNEHPFYEILGTPAFLNGGERRVFLRLRSAIEKALLPKTFRDFQDVSEIAHNMVEIQRYRRAQISLINSPVVLSELLTFVFAGNADKARKVALNYFSNSRQKSDAALNVIEVEGIAQDQVEGYGISSQSDKLRVLDSLIQVRQASAARNEEALVKRQAKSNIGNFAAEKSAGERSRFVEPADCADQGQYADRRPRLRYDKKRNLSVVKD